jgi:hypothetical protein
MKLIITSVGAVSATTARATIENSRLRRAIAASAADCKSYRILLQHVQRQQLNQEAL